MPLERGEVGRDAHDLAAVLLVRGPRALPRHLRAAEEGGGPLDPEEVVVALGEQRQAVAHAALADDLGERASGGVAVFLLAFERRLHHLHRDVRGKPFERGLLGLAFPEAEDRACDLRDDEGRQHKAKRAREGPRHGGCGRRGGRGYGLSGAGPGGGGGAP